ncbi:hypothetical protein DFJ74DRAFT_655649 [Hyaloraphidium curvatum]|nr:hypothetical protein DFJ74DRAFT_655649 [Hyaloraphidium curvatum]
MSPRPSRAPVWPILLATSSRRRARPRGPRSSAPPTPAYQVLPQYPSHAFKQKRSRFLPPQPGSQAGQRLPHSRQRLLAAASRAPIPCEQLGSPFPQRRCAGPPLLGSPGAVFGRTFPVRVLPLGLVKVTARRHARENFVGLGAFPKDHHSSAE